MNIFLTLTVTTVICTSTLKLLISTDSTSVNRVNGVFHMKGQQRERVRVSAKLQNLMPFTIPYGVILFKNSRLINLMKKSIEPSFINLMHDDEYLMYPFAP